MKITSIKMSLAGALRRAARSFGLLAIGSAAVATASAQTITLPSDYYSPWPTQRGIQNMLVQTPAGTATHGANLLFSGTGYSPFCGANGTVLWTTPISGANVSSPAIGTDGTIYIGAGTSLYALSPKDGSIKWSQDLGYVITSSPSVGFTGNIYATAGTKFFAFQPDGTTVAKFDVGTFDGKHLIYASPIPCKNLAGDAISYSTGAAFGDYNGIQWTYFDGDGSTGWTDLFSTGNRVIAPATYVDTYGPNKSIFWPLTGALVNYTVGDSNYWDIAVGQPLQSAAAVLTTSSFDEYAYVNGSDGKLHSILFGQGGTVPSLFSSATDGNSVAFVPSFVSSPAIYGDGTVYVGSYDHKVYAFPGGTSQIGAPIWTFATGATVQSSPAVASDGTVYVGPGDKTVYALNGVTGKVIWKLNVGSASISSPAIGQDGTIYVGAGNNVVAIAACHLTGVSFGSAQAAGGGNGTGTVTLDSPAPANGLIVALESKDSSFKVPATVTIPGGATSGTFTFGAPVVSTPTPETVTATFNRFQKQTGSITIVKAAITNLSGGDIQSGVYALGQVTLNVAAPDGGMVVKLSSSSSALTVSPTATVQPGSTTALFNMQAAAVTADTAVTLTAQIGSDTPVTSQATVIAPHLTALEVSPDSVNVGDPVAFTVTLDAPAGPSGMTVTLSSSNTSVATLPATIVVPSGQKTASGSIQTSTVSGSVTVTFTATLGNKQQTADLTVNGPTLAGISVPSIVPYGTVVTGTVTLTVPAGKGGYGANYVVTQVGTTKEVAKGSVNFAAGSASAQILIVAPKSGNANIVYSVVVTGTSDQKQVSASFYVAPLRVNAGMTPASIPSGGQGTFVVSLNMPAPADMKVTITLGGPKLSTLPTSAVLKKGDSMARIPFSVGGVLASTQFAARARVNNVNSQIAYCTVLPATVQLTEQQTSSKKASGTVQAYSQGKPVTLAVSSSLAIKLVSAGGGAKASTAGAVIRAGQSGASFTQTLALKKGTSGTMSTGAYYQGHPLASTSFPFQN